MSDSKLVSMPPTLWQSLDLMSAEMGVATDALVAQAVFTLARLNGYVVPGKAIEGARSTNSQLSPMASAPRSPVLKARGVPSRPEPEPEVDRDEPSDDEGNPFDEQPPSISPVANLYSADDDLSPEAPDEEPEPEPEPPPARSHKSSLTLIVAGRDPYRMTTETVTIGRGKSCEFVIDSNRVSREHVRIGREGADFVLEDLNSSNGTYFGPTKERVVAKRKIKDGDEFTLGTEKVKFQIRK